VPHPPYSLDLAICNFYLFDCIKGWLTGVTPIYADDLINEVVSILRGIFEDEKIWHSTIGLKDATGSPKIRKTIITSQTI
jgi:hypothetical protein